MADPFFTTYNGVPFCDLSAFDQEQVNNGIIPPDAEIGIDQRALIKDQYDHIKVLEANIRYLENERADAVRSLLAIGIRPGADPGILALAYKLRGY